MSYKKIPDIPYVSNGHIRQTLDLYIPEPPTTSATTKPQPFPLMIYIHGGAFMFGDKSSKLLPLRLLAKNYALASLDYRLSGDAVFPASVLDCKAAVRFLRAHAEEYNLNVDAIVAMGESAGAHHSEMLGVTSTVAEFDVGENLEWSSAVQGVVDYYGPTDFIQMDDHLVEDGKSQIHSSPDSPESRYLGKDIRECPDLVARANPITYIDGKTTCPFFIAHGTLDHIVSYHQSVILDQALREKGVDVTFETVEGADHIFKGMSREQRTVLEEKTDVFLEKIFGRVKSRI